MGAQLDRHWAVYAQPHFGFASGEIDGGGRVQALFGAALVTDFTWDERWFVGAGGGVTTFFSATSPEVLLRAGAYPLRGAPYFIEGAALQVVADVRLFVVDERTWVMPTLGLGVEWR